VCGGRREAVETVGKAAPPTLVEKGANESADEGGDPEKQDPAALPL